MDDFCGEPTGQTDRQTTEVNLQSIPPQWFFFRPPRFRVIFAGPYNKKYRAAVGGLLVTICSTRAPAPTLWVLHVFVLLFTFVQTLEEAARSIKKDTP